ncbi:hypothetical protein J2Y63_003797 [Shinella sp. BE166]|uniref:hypothetical protein n=1 Tax=Shinella sp. BE166 TaxID=3373918 RepID=UPI003EBBDDDD
MADGLDLAHQRPLLLSRIIVGEPNKGICTFARRPCNMQAGEGAGAGIEDLVGAAAEVAARNKAAVYVQGAAGRPVVLEVKLELKSIELAASTKESRLLVAFTVALVCTKEFFSRCVAESVLCRFVLFESGFDPMPRMLLLFILAVIS